MRATSIVLLLVASFVPACGTSPDTGQIGGDDAGVVEQDAASASCYGTNVGCAARSEVVCKQTAGCASVAACGGVVTACELIFNSFSCTSQEGCNWSSSSCIGTPTPCKLVPTFQCAHQDGCKPTTECVGTPAPCPQLPHDVCVLEPGCTWGTAPSADAAAPDAQTDASVADARGTCATDSDCGPLQDPNLCNARLKCRTGRCLVDPATAVHCDASGDTACAKNTCDSTTGTCTVKAMPDGTACDDGKWCTYLDSCRNGLCVGGSPQCTDPCRTCDENARQCVVAAGKCEILGTCYSVGSANPSNPCQQCQASNATAWSSSPQGTNCTSSNACLVSTSCDGAGSCTGLDRIPPAPTSFYPRDGALTGSARAPSARGARRPLLAWREGSDGCFAPTYQVQIDDTCPTTGFRNCSFPSPELDVANIVTTSWRPTTDLPVSLTQPVGARYFWRVRACRTQQQCSAWSTVHYFDVRPLHDLNGDGYSELIAGTIYNGGTTPGVLINFGSATPAAAPPDVVLHSPLTTTGDFGTSITTGDLNGDGYADLVVGTPHDFGGSSQSYVSRAMVYYGGPNGVASTPALVLQDPTQNNSQTDNAFALDVAAAGDLDSDGYADLVVGAEQARLSTPPMAYVWAGSSTGITSSPTLTIPFPPNESPGRHDANVIDTNGDMNGDGTADIVMVTASSAGAFSGYQYINLSTTPRPGWGMVYPKGIATGNDVSGDLYPETFTVSMINQANTIWVYKGSPSGPGGTPYAIPSPDPNSADAWGWTLSSRVDINGDGTKDLIAATGIAGSTANPDRLWVFLGPFSATPMPAFAPYADSTLGVQFTRAMEALGDFDGDGYDDLAVGAPLKGGNGGTVGAVLVVFGSSSGRIDARPIVFPNNAAAQNGYQYGTRFAR